MGREHELAGLGAALERAADRRPAVVLVAGESGVGKTRLVSELAARARAQGARVLTGDCVDLGDGELAYAPIVSALRGLSPDELGARRGGPRAAAAPARRPRGGHESALSQGRVFELLLGLLGRLGDAQPLVLVFEDVHWADRSSRDFLSFFVRNARHQRVAARRHLPHRRAAPPPSAAGAGGRGRARPDRRARRARALHARGDGRPARRGSSAAGPRPGWSTSSSPAPRATRSSPRSWRPPRPASACPANLRRRAHAARRGAQPARTGGAAPGGRRRPAGEPRAARARRRDRARRARGRPARGGGPQRHRHRAGDRRLRLPPRAHARGAGRRPAAGRARAAARARWRARSRPIPGCRSPPAASPPSSPTTGSPPTTCRRRSPPLRRRAPRPCGWPPSPRPTPTTSARSSCGTACPRRCARAGPSLVELIRSAAEAAHLAGEYDRAAALAAAR